jgi:hypothetical protein
MNSTLRKAGFPLIKEFVSLLTPTNMTPEILLFRSVQASLTMEHTARISHLMFQRLAKETLAAREEL